MVGAVAKVKGENGQEQGGYDSSQGFNKQDQDAYDNTSDSKELPYRAALHYSIYQQLEVPQRLAVRSNHHRGRLREMTERHRYMWLNGQQVVI